VKQLIALALVLFATVAAVAFHAHKIGQVREPQDKVAYSLEGVKKLLAFDHALKLRVAQGVPGEYPCYARLALAPRNVVLIRTEDAADTFLLIKSRQQNDSLVAHANVAWSSNNDAYDFLLLSSR
jgi:hypothetical protein